MDEKYKGKYRIPSNRLQSWDYGNPSSYFITICIKDKAHLFGEIKEGKMKLSPLGVVADILWYEIKNHSENVKLDAIIVMPNHIHGIITIVETRHALSQPSKKEIKDNKRKNNKISRFQNQGKNTISSLIGSYKSAVTKHLRRLGYEFSWQSRFYDHIIRNEKSFENISNYINDNPRRWEEDRFYR